MKKTFTYNYMLKNGGCYAEEPGKIESIFFSEGNNSITVDDILDADIPLKDKFWFICKKTHLTKEVNQQIAISIAELTLPIYEKRYPDDLRPREAIEAARQFIAGHISIEVLIEKRRAAAAAAYDAAADDAVYAAYAADAAAADAAAYAAYAADAAAADAAEIKWKLFQILKDTVANHPETL